MALSGSQLLDGENDCSNPTNANVFDRCARVADVGVDLRKFVREPRPVVG